MSLRSSAVAALLLASSAVAVPTREYPRELKQTEKRAFRAPAHRYVPSKSKRDAGTAQAHFDGGGWILPVILGGQQVSLNIDTGSSDLWTTSTLMPTDQQSTVTSGYNFDPSTASNFQYMDGSTFGIAYADGSGASGQVGIDSVTVGNAMVPSMPFGICDSLKYGGDGTGTRDTNGPVGLGFGIQNSIRPNPQCTFMECLEPYVPEPVFSCKFRTDDSGFVDFGESDSTQYTGDVTSIQIDNSTGQWNTNNVQFGSGGNVFAADPITMDFDTGTPTLNIPSAAISAYFALISGSGQQSDGTYTYPCGSTLPDFDFVFGSVNSGPATVTIPGANLKNGDASSGDCYTWISEAGDSGNAGIPFYISEYMIFNQSVPELAFAKQTLGHSDNSSGFQSIRASLDLAMAASFVSLQ